MSSSLRISGAELISTALVAALGAYIVVQSRSWDYMTPDGPGPGFFPWWIGVALFVLALLNGAVHLRDAAKGGAVHRVKWAGRGRVFAGWLAFMIAAAMLKPAGFVLTLMLLVFFLTRVIFGRPMLQSIVVAVASAAGFWLIFGKLLEVQLPTGPWGF